MLLVTRRRDEQERGWIRISAGKPVWLDLHSTPYTKINSKEASDLNAKATMMKLSEINMGVLWNGGMGKEFLRLDTKSLTRKREN